MTLTLYFREYCSLCHQMLAELKLWQQHYGFILQIVDIDADELIEARFNELVPILMNAEQEICRYRLDERRLAAQFSEIG